MKKKRWLRSTVSFVLVAAMCLGLTLSGNLGRVLAEDTEIKLVNADFGTDIWASEGAGWSTDGTDWGGKDADNNDKTTVKTDAGRLNFWQKEAGNVVLKQSVKLEAGTYQLGVEVIEGEKAAISLLFGDKKGTSTAISTGVQSHEFTLTEAGSVAVGVSIAVEAGGHGYLDNVTLKKVNTTGSTEEGTESTEEGTKDPEGNKPVTEYLDDMENAPDASWTVRWGEKEATSQKKTDQNATKNKTAVWNISSTSAQNVVITRQITVEAGKYTASVESDGDKITSGKITISDGKISKEADLAFKGWDNWTTATTDALEVSGGTKLTLTIEVDLQADGWFDLDNVKVEPADEGNKPVTEYLDDMENAPDASWTVHWGEKEATSQKKIDQNATKNKTAVWNISSTSAQNVVITRQITVEAGKYTASVESDGDKITSGKITISDGKISKEADLAFKGWDNWTTATTDVLDVTEETTLTLTIEVSLMAEGWFDLDNVKVTPVSEDEEAAKKAQKVEELQALVAECGGLVESEYTADSWMALTTALDNANAVIADKDNKTIDEIAAAHAALDTAKTGLVFAVPVVDGDLNIERIAGLPQDFIMGMDISSVMSEFASGVTYKDYDGNTIDNIADFCKLLKANGITHIRVRVWNDPFDAAGNGYGGGNNDVATAKEIADGCRAAGLKMLVDFHCSDFWADPGKQQEPKAWKGYTLDQKKDAVKSFIAESLNTIDPSKDTVAMVQVGNETTGAFVGEENTADMCVLFQAGAEAVKAYNSDVKVVIHVTNPEKGNVTKWAKNLSDNSVAYDILATSYYPYWHGTLDNLKSEFEKVKAVYEKDVMVAETSYAYTLKDSDGHNNTVRVGNNDTGENTKQPFTVQGQATAIRNLMNTVKEAGGLGVFYWEPAWLTVGDTRGLEGDAFDAQVNANKEKWEAYGSGWAASYAAEYDPGDAGKWFGGSAVDNEAMFYPDGTPTAGLHVWNYVKTGAVNQSVSVDSIGTAEETIETNGTYTLPQTVTVSYNTGNVEDPVTWESVSIDVSKPGSFVVKGTVSFSKEVTSGEYKGQTTAGTTYTLTVILPNLITDKDDAGFEKAENFTLGGTGITKLLEKDSLKDYYEGKACMHWYSADATQGTVNYNKGITLKAGAYTFEAKAQGKAGDKITLKILDADGNELFVGEPAEICGYKNWQTPSVSFALEKETEVYLQIVVDITAGGWGTADALYLYQVLPGTITVEKPEVGAGAPQTTIASSTDELQKAVLTAEELASVEKGKDIKISLKIGKKTVTDAERALIEAKLGKNTVGMYLDISLFKQIVDDTATQVTYTNGEISISIAIPKELLNSNSAVTRTYRIIRIHDNAAELLEGSFNADTGYFTFKTDAFSTYVLVYEDVPVGGGSTDQPTTPTETPGTITSGSEVEPGAPQTTITSSTDELQKAVLTADELASVENGKDIKISLKIGKKTVTDAERALIEAKLGKNTVGMYLDISLFKQIGDDAAIQVTDTNGEISISIAIPNELLNSNSAVTRTYRMIRIHNNAAELLEGSFDAKTGYFTFKTDAFSTYALVYEDTAVVTGKPQYDGWAGVSAEQKAKLMRESLAQNAAVTAPKTDDNAPLIIALLVMMAGAIVIAGAVARKRESC